MQAEIEKKFDRLVLHSIETETNSRNSDLEIISFSH